MPAEEQELEEGREEISRSGLPSIRYLVLDVMF